MSTKKTLMLGSKDAKLDSHGHLVISDPAVIEKLKGHGQRSTASDDEGVSVGVSVGVG